MQLEPNYVVGVVDGEGYFSVQVRRRRLIDGYYAHAVDFVFGVQLRQEDKEILLKLRSFFRCGKLCFKPSRKANWTPCYEFRVTSRCDLRQWIVPFFEKYQLKFPSKRQSFQRFCELLGYVERKEHLSESGLARARDLAQMVHQVLRKSSETTRQAPVIAG